MTRIALAAMLAALAACATATPNDPVGDTRVNEDGREDAGAAENADAP